MFAKYDKGVGYMDNEEYIDMLYEKYSENFEINLAYQEASKKLEKKFSEMEKKFTEEQLKDIDEFEQCLLELLEMEIKSAFKEGFKIGINFNRDN